MAISYGTFSFIVQVFLLDHLIFEDYTLKEGQKTEIHTFHNNLLAVVPRDFLWMI